MISRCGNCKGAGRCKQPVWIRTEMKRKVKFVKKRGIGMCIACYGTGCAHNPPLPRRCGQCTPRAVP